MALYFLAIALLPLAVDFNDYRPYEPVKIQLFLILTAVAFVAMAVWYVSSRATTRDHVHAHRLDLAVTAYFGTLALGTLTSVYPALSFFGSEERRVGLLLFAALFALYWLARFFLTRGVLRLFVNISAVVVLAVSAYAIAQWFGFDRQELQLVFKLYGHSGPTRVFSTLGHPNFLGLWLAMLLPLLTWAFATERSRFRYAILAAIFLGAVTLVLTYSRAAWFALAAEILAAIVFWRIATPVSKLARRALAAVLIVMLIALSIPGVLHSRLAASFDFREGSSLSRLEEWKYGVGLLPARWVTGYGPETYMWYSAFRPKLGGEHNVDETTPDPSVADRLHDIWLDTLWSGGVLALLALLAVLVTFAMRLRSHLQTAGADRGLMLAFGCSMLGWLVAVQFGFDFSQSAILWWFLLGAAASDEVI